MRYRLTAVRRFAVSIGLSIGLLSALSVGPTCLDSLEAANLSWIIAPATAQPLRIEELWQKVYRDLPDLPWENQYVNRETGDVSPNNTLVSRLIRYHIYIKGRPVNYRFDWKLTLADYLGSNERMEPETYPSGTSLTTNPITGDIAAVQSLTRSQRDALVTALVQLFSPASSPPDPASPPPVSSPASPPPPSPPTNSRFPQQPQPGDAQLLLP